MGTASHLHPRMVCQAESRDRLCRVPHQPTSTIALRWRTASLEAPNALAMSRAVFWHRPFLGRLAKSHEFTRRFLDVPSCARRLEKPLVGKGGIRIRAKVSRTNRRLAVRRFRNFGTDLSSLRVVHSKEHEYVPASLWVLLEGFEQSVRCLTTVHDLDVYHFQLWRACLQRIFEVIAGERDSIVQVPEFRVRIGKCRLKDPLVDLVLLGEINPRIFLEDLEKRARCIIRICNHTNEIDSLYGCHQSSNIAINPLEVLVVDKLQLPIDPQLLCLENQPRDRFQTVMTHGEVSIGSEAGLKPNLLARRQWRLIPYQVHSELGGTAKASQISWTFPQSSGSHVRSKPSSFLRSSAMRLRSLSISPEGKLLSALLHYRGRDAGHPTPPAQSRTCGTPAYGSSLGCLASKRTLGNGCRMC
jgi:hypothetical protein